MALEVASAHWQLTNKALLLVCRDLDCKFSVKRTTEPMEKWLTNILTLSVGWLHLSSLITDTLTAHFMPQLSNVMGAYMEKYATCIKDRIPHSKVCTINNNHITHESPEQTMLVCESC